MALQETVIINTGLKKDLREVSYLYLSAGQKYQPIDKEEDLPVHSKQIKNIKNNIITFLTFNYHEYRNKTKEEWS